MRCVGIERAEWEFCVTSMDAVTAIQLTVRLLTTVFTIIPLRYTRAVRHTRIVMNVISAENHNNPRGWLTLLFLVRFKEITHSHGSARVL